MAPLALKADSDPRLVLELGGQDKAGAFLTGSIELTTRKRLEVPDEFYSLTHLHIDARPRGMIGVSSPAVRETHLVRSGDWGDLWIHGKEILLLGWMNHEEFELRAKVIPAGSRVFQFSRTRTKNLAVSVSDLKPMARLLTGAQS